MTALPQLPRLYALLRAHRWAKGPLPPSSSTVGRERARHGQRPRWNAVRRRVEIVPR